MDSTVRVRPAWPVVLVGLVVGLILAAVLALFVAAPLALGRGGSGILSAFYTNVGVKLAARTHAATSSAPAQANAGQFAGRFQRSAADAFVGSCADCHGVKGDGKGPLGATVPPATDLTSHDAKERSDAELFWIVKNGLGFSAMPGYASQYSDQEITNMVAYIRSLQNGSAQPVTVPTPTAQQLAAANPVGDAVQKGAAVYFAQGCAACHGATGNAPGNLALRGGGEVQGAVRRGRPGMPAYNTDKISNQDLQALSAYMRSWPAPAPGQRRGEGEGERGGDD